MRMVHVIDTETTGLDPNKDQVVEVAVVTMYPNPWRVVGHFRSLVMPTVPIQVEAMAAHHITPEMLEDAPDADTVCEALVTYLDGVGDESHPRAAHNAEFDSRMIAPLWPGAGGPWLCTYKCARHLYQDAPKFSNQVLRYHLQLEVPPLEGPPHRALPDAMVTSYLLDYMLEEHELEDLVELTTKPILLRNVEFGKHRGLAWADLAKTVDGRDYMKWVLRQDFDLDVVHTVRHHLGVRT